MKSGILVFVLLYSAPAFGQSAKKVNAQLRAELKTLETKHCA